MYMASRKPKQYQCRFCRALTGQNQAVSLFTNKSIQKGWVSRISNFWNFLLRKTTNSPPTCVTNAQQK